MLSVHQHWDPLQVCVVGRSYPPEFYSFIQNPKARSVMERIAIETEEDYQKIINLLKSFNVEVLRTDISDNIDDHYWAGSYSPPPMCPRDHTAMIGETFFMPGSDYGMDVLWGALTNYYITDNSPDTHFFSSITDIKDLKNLTVKQKEEFCKIFQKKLMQMPEHMRLSVLETFKGILASVNHNPFATFPNNKKFNTFSTMEKYIKDQGNRIVYDKFVNSACMTVLGKDLYYGSTVPDNKFSYENLKKIYSELKTEYFPDYRMHLVKADTHGDATYTPVKPGLIISLFDVQNYAKSFPDWEVVYLPRQGEFDLKVQSFLELKHKNRGKWWVPGEELNDDFTDFVETWLKDWVIYVEETVFDVNMLIIDPTNVIVTGYNKTVFDAFERHGITPHIINFRHRYFWDGGIHCITSDLSRSGTRQDYFPERN